MDPRKNARRGYAQRQSRRLQASQWQPQVFTPERSGKKMSDNLRKFLVVVVVCITILCLGLVIVSIILPGGVMFFFTPDTEYVPPTQETLTLIPTEGPINTPVPTEVVPPVVAPMSCDTPSIQASLDGQTWTEQGEYLDTVLGKRMTFTNRKIVVPSKAWNDPLTAAELKLVETTWVSMKICVPEGITGRIFAGGFEQGVNRLEHGVLMTLSPGLYEFKIRNGEVVLWYPNQDSFSAKDLTRIVEQIKVGNFDIRSPLDFFGVTTDILPSIPAELVKERNVQLIPFPEPVVK